MSFLATGVCFYLQLDAVVTFEYFFVRELSGTHVDVLATWISFCSYLKYLIPFEDPFLR